MAATINADNGVSSGSSGLKSTADTSGVLALQSNGSTALSISTGLVTTLTNPLPVGSGGTGITTTPTAGAVPYGNGTTLAYTAAGTSGQVLTSAGAGAPTWATASTSYIKTDLTPYDATLTLPSALGTYRQYLAVSLTATTELILLWGSTATFAAVWDNTTKTFGTPVLVRTAAIANSANVAAYSISSTSVLVCSLVTTALQTVVLSISGSTITVNTAVATTLAASSTLQQNPDSNNGTGRILLVGTSYVLNYANNTSNQPCFRAITVSGVTPTVGSELTFAAGSQTSFFASYVYSSSILVHISASATLLYAVPISVSGTTLTKGTQATTTTTGFNSVSGSLSSNRIAVGFINSGLYGAIVSVAGTTASISSVLLTGNVTSSPNMYMQVFGLQAVIVASQTTSANEAVVLTDNAGTAVAGATVIINPFGNTTTWQTIGCSASEVFVQNISNNAGLSVIGISGNNPILNKAFPIIGNLSNSGTGVQMAAYTTAGYANFENGGTIRTATYKTVTMQTAGDFFASSFNGTSIAQLQQAVGFIANGTVIRSSLSNAACWMSYANATAAVNTTVYFRRVELA